MADVARRARLDVMTVFGLLLATGGIVGGLILEGQFEGLLRQE